MTRPDIKILTPNPQLEPSFKRQSLQRFITVGVLNTLIDITIYILLRELSVDIFIANLCSTSVALICSFYLNRSYTFRAKGTDLRVQTIRFFSITLFGLWVIQPVAIKLIEASDRILFYATLLPSDTNPEVLIPKLGATCITLVWNYFWYKNYVFIIKQQ